jgi:hypothetical protein
MCVFLIYFFILKNFILETKQKVNKFFHSNFRGMAPKGVVCYICGREFGLSSIAIHEPQCLKVKNFSSIFFIYSAMK